MKRLFNLFRQHPAATSHRSVKTRLNLETLGERITPAAGVFLKGSQLLIEGTAGNDVARVSVSGKDISVEFNGVVKTFSKARSILFHGGNGNDTFVNNTALPSRAEGGNGNDDLTGGSAADALFGGSGDDRLTGQSGNDQLLGEAGNDRLSGGVGNDSLSGGTGSDDLAGDDGNDSLSGDAGDDRLVGGAGRDRARGGQGLDTSVRDQNDVGDDSERQEGLQQADGLAKIEGTITAIDGQNVTIRTAAGVDVSVVIATSTVLEKNGAHVSLSDFAVGDAAEAKYDATTAVAAKLESGQDATDDNGGKSGQKAEGTVSALTDSSVTLTLQNGTTVTVTIDSNTKLERNDQHVSGLTAFKLGDRGEALFDATTMVASKFEAVGA